MAKQLTSLSHYYDELEVGDEFESTTRTVTDDDVMTFAQLSGDHHPLHTDDDYARSGQFGARVAHGCLTLSLASGLEYDMIGPGETPFVAFYGMDRVRFVRPVFIGDALHIEGVVSALEPKDPGRGIVTLHQSIVNQAGEAVAVLEKRMLCRTRSGR